MDFLFETERLLLRRFSNEDADLIYELNADPEVTRFTNGLIHDKQQAEEVLLKKILPQYKLYNYGRWAVMSKSTMEFIGWCGLKYRPEIKEVDLGYRFKKSVWGKGFATEAAAACIRYGFEKIGLERIEARAAIGNTRSWRVLEKCGMKYTGMGEVDGIPVKIYEAWNPSVI